jgi:hypothetical protein
MRDKIMRISNGPHDQALSYPEVSEPEHNTDLFTLRKEGGILYNPTCKANVTKLRAVEWHKTSNSM